PFERPEQARRRPAPTEGDETHPGLDVAPQRLLALNRFEERFEIPLPEASASRSFDDLEEHRRAVLDRLGEDLEQVALIVAVDEDSEPRQLALVLVDLPDTVFQHLVVAVRDADELDTGVAKVGDGGADVARGEGDVLDAGPAVELQILLDLGFLFPGGGLVDREFHLSAAVRH